MQALLLVAEHDGPTMFTRIGVMRALNRHVERVFNVRERLAAGSASVTRTGHGPASVGVWGKAGPCRPPNWTRRPDLITGIFHGCSCDILNSAWVRQRRPIDKATPSHRIERVTGHPEREWLEFPIETAPSPYPADERKPKAAFMQRSGTRSNDRPRTPALGTSTHDQENNA